MMKRRVLSIVMALALCLGLLPAPAWAEEVEPAATVLTVQDNQSIWLQQQEDGQPYYVIYNSNNIVGSSTFKNLILTGSAQGASITFGGTLPAGTSVTLRDLHITTYRDSLYVCGNYEIKIEGDVSFSAAAASTIVIDKPTEGESSVRMTGSGNLTVTHGEQEAAIENDGSLAIDIEGDVRMEALGGTLFKNNSDAHPISISAKNITLSDSTDNTSFDGVTLTLSRTSSINGQFPVALVRVNGVETYHTDIKAAFAAADAAGSATIELLADVTLPEKTSLTVAKDKNLTLNCGDFTLSGSYGNVIAVFGTLHFLGGTMKNTEGENAVSVREGGTFNMSDGTLEAADANAPAVGTVGLSNKTANVTIRGGSVGAGGTGLDIGAYTTVQLSGGTYGKIVAGGENAYIPGYSDITVPGLLAKDKNYAFFKDGAPVALEAKQHVLEGPVTVAECTHAGAEAADNRDGTHDITCHACGYSATGKAHTWDDNYTCVCGAQAVAKIEKAGMDPSFVETAEQLADAFTNNDGATITLLADVEQTSEIIINSGTLTLDLNGKEILNQAEEVGPSLTVSGGELTIRDNAAGGKITAEKFDGIYIIGGTVYLNGGTVTGTTGVTVNSGTLTVSGDAEIIGTLYYGVIATSGSTVSLSGGTFKSPDAQNMIVPGKGKALRELLDPGCAYFYDGKVPVLQSDLSDRQFPSWDYTSVTVKTCTHEGVKATPNDDGTTHSITCPYCGYTAKADACTYGKEYGSDAENHWQTCTLCGGKKTAAHDAFTTIATADGTVITVKEGCATCGYGAELGKVTITIPQITYGETEKEITWTRTIPSQYPVILQADSGDTLQYGDDCLSAPLADLFGNTEMTAGEHTLKVNLLIDNTSPAFELPFTVDRATLSGKPAFGSGEGKKLSEVEVTLPESWPTGGTFTWEAGVDTQVVRGTSYAYTYTSPDGNYAASGSVVLWAAPSTGGGGGGYIPSTPPVSTGTTTEGGTPTTETTAVPTASVSGGKATATVDTSTGSEIVKQAVANDSETVVIAPKITGDVSRAEVSIPASTVGQIGSQTEASLTVSTPVADVTIPNGGLGSLGSAGGTVTVAAEKTGNTVELTVTAGGETVESVPGGVTLTVPAENTTPGTVAVLVREDGTREVVRKSVAGDGSVTIPLEGSAKLEIVDNSKRFDDVPATGWVAEAAAFVSSHELFQGTAPGRFSPDAPMSRGMLAVVLHNLENNPTQALTGAFSDVSGGQWYAEGVAWAEAQGIIGGYGNGRFGPDDSVTREQLAVMLWRYAGSPAATDRELHFADTDRTSDWAVEALRWAVEKGILDGKGGGALDPTGQATRAETAQMLMNFMEKR